MTIMFNNLNSDSIVQVMSVFILIKIIILIINHVYCNVMTINLNVFA